MLQSLSIRDFVIVDALELEFQNGFTVFSGETGAGKSILIDALALALGQRGDASVVRDGATRAEVVAQFVPNAPALAWLADQAIEDTDTLLLRRVLDTSGRSRAWVNGVATTLAQLRELGASLVDIHGQQEHQSLLRASAQRELLDECFGLSELADRLASSYARWQQLHAQRATFERDRSALEQEREHLEWQVGELERLALKSDEWESVQLEHQRLAHAAALIEGAEGALDRLSEADGALLSELASMIQRLSHLGQIDATLEPVIEALEPGRIQLQEAAYALKDYLQRIELDPARLAAVESRLAAIHDAARKFHVAPNELPALLAQRAEQLAQLTGVKDLEGLRAEERAEEAAYRQLAAELSKARRAAGEQLGRAVSEGMQSLSMKGGRFEVALPPCPASAHGVEEVEFLVAAHANAPARPLAKVASGGELSRISLALSVVTANASSVPTLIFDEVDAGIGGAVAEVVGRLLRQLGRLRQVLCVTHLPQVAAQGDAHFSVNKVVRDAQTVSQVAPLDGGARVDELARMLGGIEITATTRKHARELLAGVA